MSKKDIRKKFNRSGEQFKSGILYKVGGMLKRYFAKRTTKLKHKNVSDDCSCCD